jgi:hypothetical protein
MIAYVYYVTPREGRPVNILCERSKMVVDSWHVSVVKILIAMLKTLCNGSCLCTGVSHGNRLCQVWSNVLSSYVRIRDGILELI